MTSVQNFSWIQFWISTSSSSPCEPFHQKHRLCSWYFHALIISIWGCSPFLKQDLSIFSDDWAQNLALKWAVFERFNLKKKNAQQPRKIWTVFERFIVKNSDANSDWIQHPWNSDAKKIQKVDDLNPVIGICEVTLWGLRIFPLNMAAQIYVVFEIWRF